MPFNTTQTLCVSLVHDTEPPDVNQDAIERHRVTAPSSSMEENDAGPFPKTNLVAGLGKGVSRIIAPLVFPHEYVALIGRRRGASRP